MKGSAVTKTVMGNSTITVTGVYDADAKDTLEDVIKKLIIRRIYVENGVDLSEKQRENGQNEGGDSNESSQKHA